MSPLEPRENANAVGVADGTGLVELPVRLSLELRELVRQRPVERYLEHAESDDARSALGCEPAGEIHRRVRRLAADDGDEETAVLERERGAEGRWRLHGLAEAGMDHARR